jgi:hypothetical protein
MSDTLYIYRHFPSDLPYVKPPKAHFPPKENPKTNKIEINMSNEEQCQAGVSKSSDEPCQCASPYEKLLKEKGEVTEKIGKLRGYASGEEFKSLSGEMKLIVRRQIDSLEDYLDALEDRIKHTPHDVNIGPPDAEISSSEAAAQLEDDDYATEEQEKKTSSED